MTSTVHVGTREGLWRLDDNQVFPVEPFTGKSLTALALDGGHRGVRTPDPRAPPPPRGRSGRRGRRLRREPGRRRFLEIHHRRHARALPARGGRERRHGIGLGFDGTRRPPRRDLSRPARRRSGVRTLRRRLTELVRRQRRHRLPGRRRRPRRLRYRGRTRVPIARRRRALGDRGQGVAARPVRRPVMTRTRHAITGLTIALLLASAAPGRAQTIYAPETTDRYFQVEFDVTHNRKGPAVEGYVYNRGRTAAQRVRLQIQRVDAAGSVVGSSTI